MFNILPSKESFLDEHIYRVSLELWVDGIFITNVVDAPQGGLSTDLFTPTFWDSDTRMSLMGTNANSNAELFFFAMYNKVIDLL